MAPLVRRSWSPRGCTPVLRQRGRWCGKVSVIAAVVLTACGAARGLYFRLYKDENIGRRHLLAFLRQLRRQCSPRLVVVWDRLGAHKSPRLHYYAGTHRIDLEFLPAYAPELNPVEYAWAYLKMNPLANYAARDSSELAETSHRIGRHLQHQIPLIHSFAAASPLFFRP